MAAGDASIPFPIYGAAYRITVPILDNDGDLVADAAGLDTELSLDGGTFAAATHEATQIAAASGMYYLDLAYDELQCSTLAGKVQSSTADSKDTPFVLYPRILPILLAGTAQAGGASSITLAADASAINGFYNGCIVLPITNTGVGQARVITHYAGSTKVATVVPAWTQPDNTTAYNVLLTDMAVNRILDTDQIGAAQLAAETIGASELAAAAASEIAAAVQTLLAGENLKVYYAQIQRNESVAERRTVYFYATGTLPAKADLSTNGGAFGDSDNAPATVNGNRRELEVSQAETAALGRLVADVTTTTTVFTAFLIIDIVEWDPFDEGSVTDVARRVRAAQDAI